MDMVSVLEALSQADTAQSSEIVEKFIRDVALATFLDVMFQEVEQLCGPKYKGGQSDHRRAGSAIGKVCLGIHSEAFRRPRVRQCTENAKEVEVILKSYESGKHGAELRAAIIRALMAGVSTREAKRLYPEASRVSRSEVSRQWEKASLKYIEELRTRDLSIHRFIALLIDGIYLDDSLCAVIGVGITEDGKKLMLDYEIGSSENNEVCKALTARLKERGFTPAASRLFTVLDGAKALRTAVLAQWPNALIQTCLVHVERGIRKRLSRTNQSELAMLFKGLRSSADLDAAKEAMSSIKRFVAGKSQQGLVVFENAESEMMTLFSLGVSDIFNLSFLSTNVIENSIRNMRGLLGRVKRWRQTSMMADRWTATAMVKAEASFKRVKGYKDLAKLKEALNGVRPAAAGPHGGPYVECEPMLAELTVTKSTV